MKILIVGAGKVGCTFARALRGGPHRVTLRAARRGAPARPPAVDLVILAVRDDALAPLAAELAERRTLGRRAAVVHVAGALGPEVLAPLRALTAGVGQAHPLISFASSRVRPTLRGGHLLVAGDAAAVRRARTLARALGMTARQWPKLDRASYHAAAGLVAGGAATLAAAGARLLEAAGAPRGDAARVLGPLLRSVAENVERLGLPGALTGPVRRGDAATVGRHLASVMDRTPELVPLYLAIAAAELPIARALGDAPAASFDELERLLKTFASQGAERARRARARG
jgi:predicted short-subunit dehydrogenase-like oxidoreductase (DUF2520 family)